MNYQIRKWNESWNSSPVQWIDSRSMAGQMARDLSREDPETIYSVHDLDFGLLVGYRNGESLLVIVYEGVRVFAEEVEDDAEPAKAREE